MFFFCLQLEYIPCFEKLIGGYFFCYFLFYFDESRAIIAKQSLKFTSHLKDLDISVLVQGGGLNGQAEAIRYGIARALIKYDKELKSTLKAKGWLTRDDRRKERKKPGLKKARRSPQWSKR